MPEPSDDHGSLPPPPGRALAISVGNTSTRIGLINGLSVVAGRSVPATDLDAVLSSAEALTREADESAESSGSGSDSSDPVESVLLATVNRSASDPVVAALGPRLGLPVQAFGASLPVPIATEVEDAARVGQDRLLAALGAFGVVQQACVVIDAGTALTIDFVDGQGVFHGGAIMPGAQAMLDTLASSTDALPRLALEDMPDPLEPFGKSTAHAMFLGVRAAIRGSVRYLAERYADYYDAYPQIIATGGNATLLLGGDELIETIVPDLVLTGMAAARARYIAGETEAGDGGGPSDG